MKCPAVAPAYSPQPSSRFVQVSALGGSWHLLPSYAPHLSPRSCCDILNNVCICQKSAPAYSEHHTCDLHSALSGSQRVQYFTNTPLMLLVPRVSLGFLGQTGDLGSMPYWAKYLKQSKCSLFVSHCKRE